MKRIALGIVMLSAAMFALPAMAALPDNLVGKIFLQVENNGEAWYVNPATETRYYLQTGDHAYAAMSMFGLGITDADLWKIPVGVSTTTSIVDDDVDSDGLNDTLEHAIGTAGDYDTDDDGYSDLIEIQTGFSPYGPGMVAVDDALVTRLSGYIVLQVEANGEAWYINPADGKRYYMKDGQAAYDIMGYMGVGITDADLATIAIDPISPLPPTSPWMAYSHSGTGFDFNLDLPSYSFVTDVSTSDSLQFTASIANGESALTFSWLEGSKSAADFLGDTVTDSHCIPVLHGTVSGDQCLRVTSAGINAFMFESNGYTFMIVDLNSGEFSDADWSHVISSTTVIAN